MAILQLATMGVSPHSSRPTAIISGMRWPRRPKGADSTCVECRRGIWMRERKLIFIVL